MTETTEGIVKKVSHKENRYGVNVNDAWYNSFGEAEAAEGDRVKITYTVKGQWNNINTIEVLEKGKPKPQTQPTHRNQRTLEDVVGLMGECIKEARSLATNPSDTKDIALELFRAMK